MSRTFALSIPRMQGVAFAALPILALMLVLAARPARLDAQARHAGTVVSLRPFVGGFVPTGDHRDLLRDAVVAGAQLSWHAHRNLRVVGTVAWSPSRDRTTWGPQGAPRDNERVDVLQYDLGLEGRLPDAILLGAWGATPFLSIGAGGRTYDYRDVDGTDAETGVAGFAGIGADLAPRGARWGLRLEARDYVSGFRGLRGELPDRRTRNDLLLMAGMTLGLGRR